MGRGRTIGKQTGVDERKATKIATFSASVHSCVHRFLSGLPQFDSFDWAPWCRSVWPGSSQSPGALTVAISLSSMQRAIARRWRAFPPEQAFAHSLCSVAHAEARCMLYVMLYFALFLIVYVPFFSSRSAGRFVEVQFSDPRRILSNERFLRQ